MKRVLVAGPTGYLGRYVVKELKKQGFYIKALVRNPDKLTQTGEFMEPSIADDVDEIVIGDVTKPDTLKNICEDIDVVFSSVGITLNSEGSTFEDVDYQGNVNLLQEAERSRVAKFMYIHVCTDDNWKKPGPLFEAKKRFVEVLTASHIDHIIIRPTGYFSDLAMLLLMAEKGRVYLVGDGRANMNPIHGEDLAQFCVMSFSKINRTLDVGGPETLSYARMARLAFDVLEQKEHITYLPFFLLKTVSLGLKWFTKNTYGLYRFFMNVMTHDVTAPRHGQHRMRDFFNEMIEMEKIR